MRIVIRTVISARTAAMLNVARNESAYACTTCSRYRGGSSTIACTDLRTFWITCFAVSLKVTGIVCRKTRGK